MRLRSPLSERGRHRRAELSWSLLQLLVRGRALLRELLISFGRVSRLRDGGYGAPAQAGGSKEGIDARVERVGAENDSEVQELRHRHHQSGWQLRDRPFYLPTVYSCENSKTGEAAAQLNGFASTRDIGSAPVQQEHGASTRSRKNGGVDEESWQPLIIDLDWRSDGPLRMTGSRFARSKMPLG